MAEAITLEGGQQQAAARQLELDRHRQRQTAALERAAERNKQRLQPPPAVSAIAAEAEADRRTYRRRWQYAQEGVENLAFSFVDLMIISGPVVLLFFFARFVVGNLYSGGPTVSFRSTKVPLVPGYTVVEGLYRTAKFLFIGLITGAVYSAIIMAGYVYTHPLETIKLAVLSAFCWLSSFFGVVASAAC